MGSRTNRFRPTPAAPTTPARRSAPTTFDGGTASGSTDAQGDTTIGGLPVAAYLVCETSAPSTVKTKAAPFLVTVPFPNNSTNAANGNGEWLYDVNVYPKNTVVLAPSKGVDVAANGLKTDSQVTFPVTATVPSIASTDSFKHFVISDPLEPSPRCRTPTGWRCAPWSRGWI